MSERTDFRFIVPVSPGQFVELLGPFPMTEAEWTVFDNVMATMRPPLTTIDQPEQENR